MADFLETTKALVKSGTDLTLRQIAVLASCAKSRPAQERQTSALAEELGMAKPAVTRVTKALFDAELIATGSLPRDRRTCVLSQTAKGAAFVRKVS